MTKTGPQAARCGGADEYAMSDPHTQPMNSLLTGVRHTPGDAGSEGNRRSTRFATP
jgi:hypothetical protein